ncbi:MAG TPA: DUF2927 domain-containing protein [Candidatus Scatomorpha intestinavium]|uniref:DUF2927 domain-containing protein n=1 Tax=Candidatus Scatomorpha intestinavium TaxID=2840922 RepID=A0A9D0ZCL9_9FIRM|nr:DUF2927 domain-containing protein [Candidatus Scatomorpha intestinavium]
MKKPVSLVLLCAFALTLSLSANASSGLSDVEPGAWYYGEVSRMVADGHISGYEDGTFRPERSVSAAEAVTLAARMTGAATGADESHWAGVQMAYAYESGWLSEEDVPRTGYDSAATRELFCKIVAAAFGISVQDGAELSFSDAAEISPGCLDGVLALSSNGLIEGFEDGSFRPGAPLTRAQAAAILFRAAYPGEADGDLITAEGYTGGEIIDYFCSVALGSEYGDEFCNVVRWDEPVAYYIYGSPTEEDLERFTALAEALCSVPGFPGISAAEEPGAANLNVHFISQAEMDDILGDGYNGYVTVWWNDFIINEGEIYYSTDITQSLRNAVIAEELCQGLGLLTDTYDHPESIFYQYHETADWPSALDWAIIRLLYSGVISPGMTEDEVHAAAVSAVG